MVYVNSDGTVCNQKPWGLSSILNIFTGIIAFVIFFFQSLFGLENRKNNASGRSGGFKGSGGGGGGGSFWRPGGGGGGGGGSGGPRIRTMRDINPPSVNAGGCPGGSCGL